MRRSLRQTFLRHKVHGQLRLQEQIRHDESQANNGKHEQSVQQKGLAVIRESGNATTYEDNNWIRENPSDE